MATLKELSVRVTPPPTSTTSSAVSTATASSPPAPSPSASDPPVTPAPSPPPSPRPASPWPRTAADQAGVGRRVPASARIAALRPVDLVFFAFDPTRDSTIHHVAIYLGNGQMINAPAPAPRCAPRLCGTTASPEGGGDRLVHRARRFGAGADPRGSGRR
ncbi:NlpC/P60 family protein [Streptomyces sp. NPDC059534]|uniref:NlpC/P60 family protein n=1 Tax=Streptomyces sp. NPDC059534 TaxID=3346859 RepID=UPI00369F14AD